MGVSDLSQFVEKPQQRRLDSSLRTLLRKCGQLLSYLKGELTPSDAQAPALPGTKHLPQGMWDFIRGYSRDHRELTFNSLAAAVLASPTGAALSGMYFLYHMRGHLRSAFAASSLRHRIVEKLGGLSAAFGEVVTSIFQFAASLFSIFRRSPLALTSSKVEDKNGNFRAWMRSDPLLLSPSAPTAHAAPLRCAPRAKTQCASMLHYGMVTCYWRDSEEQFDSVAYDPDSTRGDPESRVTDLAIQPPYMTDAPMYLAKFAHRTLYQSYGQERVAAYLAMLEQGRLSGYRAVSSAPGVTAGSELDYVAEYWLTRPTAFNVLDAEGVRILNVQLLS